MKQEKEQMVNALILNGDLHLLSAEEKINYYHGYCKRLGLDPFTKPFDILRMKDKEVLYCTRSGTQQLNKKYAVSHTIVARDLLSEYGVYQVVARASTPDGRCTESIGAVGIVNLKGEAYANAVMKAETKAKRRATLDLLGLGILDESETESIPNAVAISVNIQDVEEPEIIIDERYNKSYTDIEDITELIDLAESITELRDLYLMNTNLFESNSELKQILSNRKKQIKNEKQSN